MRSSWLLGGAALLFLAPFACSSSFSTAESTGGSGGTASTTSGSGGTGNAMQTGFSCDAPTDCPPATSQCETVDCVQHRCFKSPITSGKQVPNPIVGNCTAEVCDGAGNQTTTPDDSDVYDDGNPCTVDTCINHKPSNAPQAGGACTIKDTKESGVCDANGDCVECQTGSDCKNNGRPICQQGRCIAATCGDLIKDGQETDVDCGGTDCAPCLDGKKCSTGSDCVSDVCTDGLCAVSSCTDGVKNGHETDKDCGGPDCPKRCPDGDDCAAPTDCASGVCQGGTCKAPSCSDGVQNGDETDQDCGGSCPACIDGKTCKVDKDCATANCDATNHCNHCDDGKPDFGESDTDCGASCAMEMGSLCDDGKHCTRNEDCTSGTCCLSGSSGNPTGTCAEHCN
jgi:hypothetical protein